MGHQDSIPGDGQQLSIGSVVHKILLEGPHRWYDACQTVLSNAFMATDTVMKPVETDVAVTSVDRFHSMESQSCARSLRSSSSSSFDSCSDLLGSLDLQQKGIQQDWESFPEGNHAEQERGYSSIHLARRESQNSAEEDAEGLFTPIDGDRREVFSDQLLERSALLQSSSVNAPLCKIPLSPLESTDLVTGSKLVGRYMVDPKTDASALSETVNAHLKPCYKIERHVNSGMEASEETFGRALDKEENLGSVQRTKDVILLPFRDLNAKASLTENVVDWHIQRFLNSETEEVNEKPYEDGACLSADSRAWDPETSTEITNLATEDVYSASPSFAKEEQVVTPSDVESSTFCVADAKGLDPLKLPSSEIFLVGKETSHIQGQSTVLPIFKVATNEKGRGTYCSPENGMQVGVKDQYSSSSNVAFGQGDCDEFVQESVKQRTSDINPAPCGNSGGVVGLLVEGAHCVAHDDNHTQNTEERMFDILDCDDDLQQLEDTIKFFNLHKSNTSVSDPLHSLSSGSGRPDLEEVDKQFDSNRFLGRDQCFAGKLSTQYKEPEVHDPSVKEGLMKKQSSADMLSELDSDSARLDNADLSKEYANERGLGLAGLPFRNSEEHHVRSGLYPNRQSVWLDSRVQVPDLKDTEVLDSNSNSLDNLSKIASGNWSERVFADSEDRKEDRHWPLLEKDMHGKVPYTRRLERASSQVKSRNASGWEAEDLGPDELSRYVEALDVNETYVDTVLDMEDVLLNSDESSRGRFLQTSNGTMISTPRPSRDGSLSSSTSGTQMFSSDYNASARDIPFTVDWVEVVGAKQRKGGSSLGERMVGVKDHTVYCIKVVSGKDKWEVSRRYRDFVDLYHQLKRIFSTQVEKSLPSAWEEVEYESRKVFGSTSPNVIEVRSSRIERCLQSLLQEGPPFGTISPLHWFLRPKGIDEQCRFEDHQSLQASSAQQGSNVQLGALDSPQLQSPRSDTGSNRTDLDQDRSPFILGNTVKLILKIHPNKSLKQLIHAQHYACAGCYKHLDLEKGVVQGLAQTFGWRKPRYCEYSGQLFCASCHLNETAVLPAQVLRNWDFTARRVCQLAKAYLDSIYDQPMLCVSAVNPYLYSRVPVLTHIKETRRKLSRMLSCVNCPSRARVQQTLASRKYLLESNDFFALRDLEDLSKGAFAVLPGLLAAVMENLKAHITKQCSVCQDTGEWCGAGILCEDPFSPIFPFQEDNIIHCKICHTPFHKNCFTKCHPCPSCTKDWSHEAIQAAKSSGSPELEGLDDQGDVAIFSDSQLIAREASSSSLSAPEYQGSSSEVEEKPHRNWAFNNLFTGRLW